jgi:hypothetical protein
VDESAVLLAGDLAWPIVVLLIATLLLATQRMPIGRLIDRVRSLKYPGGEAHLGSVSEKEADTIQTVVDTLSRDPLSERADRPESAGEVTISIQNREPLGDFDPLPAEEVTNLVLLRTRVANLLSELAYPPPPGGFGPVSATIETLHKRGVLDAPQAQALRDVLDTADEAARGAIVPPRVAVAVENSGSAILEQLALLRTVAAARFEDHVLETLQRRLPPEYSVDIDRAIESDGHPGGSAADALLPRIHHARVDALVTAGDRSVVVEVRARLQPDSYGQIEAVREWMRALPATLPVLLVMLGEGLGPRELDRIKDGRPGPVEILLWDKDSGSLIEVLRHLLARSAELQHSSSLGASAG